MLKVGKSHLTSSYQGHAKLTPHHRSDSASRLHHCAESAETNRYPPPERGSCCCCCCVTVTFLGTDRLAPRVCNQTPALFTKGFVELLTVQKPAQSPKSPRRAVLALLLISKLSAPSTVTATTWNGVRGKRTAPGILCLNNHQRV